MPATAPTFKLATNITETYNAVNPEQPLLPGDPRYVDCAPVRGDEHIVNMIAQRIIRAEAAKPVQHLKQLLAGHRGCGKSTELLLLKDRLEREGFFVVYFDAALEIDMNDVDYADILLAMMRQLDLQVRESPLGLQLDAGRLDDLAMRLAKVTLEKEDRNLVENTLETEFRVEPQIPFFAKMMAAVRGFLTSGSTYKKQLRVEIQQRTAQFLEDLNDLIDKLQQQLRERGKEGLVIIIDSLDRIIPHPLDDKGWRTTHSAIYLEHADHLKAPHCHAIYTVPISIYFNENLSKAYPDLPLMLPMIKIREENGTICAAGLEAMRRVVVQRVQIKSVFKNKKSVDKLCLASGGHVRDLMILLRYACDYSAEQITPLAVDKAIRALVREYDRLVKDADLPRLVRIHREKRLPSDAEYALLPYHLIVLEYQNGERWADVHPAVQETRKFQEAWENEPKALPQKPAAKAGRKTRRAGR
ncbi:MAG: ATP-binding protein [candidate division KSB1 bacterium]|nr:ATP-binding protein [candidate division KSB1 bacterium]MDZ7272994.1 ATP-binding protein [candidate division KSB1 bacterium]MDZ7285097.1 ATP-binding protein [candidate division KSB1 bacterium]MDZ7298129.1 ATP-binding protein [candidate division KSB1 bacterium]MDZ7349238.1 ATP-binding protein [candidate division KSB1 bacterium]